MKEMIEAFRTEVERTEAAHLRFITMRTVEARNLLDMLEQTSRAQRTDEWESAAPVGREFAAAGQAGLAKLQRWDAELYLRGPLSIPDARAAQYDTGRFFMVDDVCNLFATLAAPVAAGTERAIPEGWKLVPIEPTAEMLVAGAESEDKDFGLVIHNCYCAIIAAAPAAPLATPADAGAGQIDERAEFEKAMEFYYAELERTKDGAYTYGTTRTAWLAWQARARLSTSGAPVTAEPAFYVIVDADGLPEFATKGRREAQEHINDACDSDAVYAGKWKAVPVYTHSAPADRDAIRNKALEEAAKACEGVQDKCQRRDGGKWPELRDDAESGAGQCAEAVRALKSMERAADAAETRDAKGGD